MTRKRYKNKTDITIVIPVFGMFNLLEECIKSIPEACGKYSWELVLFDNNSPDRDEANENVGFPIACNKGVSRGKADLIFLLNSDVVLLPKSVESMARKFRDPEIGVVGMKLLFPEDSIDNNRPPGTIQHVGLSVDIKGMFQHSFIGWSKDNPRVDRVYEVSAVTGAALMTRRKIWLRAKGFFEGYGLGTFEDVDYCYTVREMDYKVIVDVDAVGYHYTNATASHYRIPYPLQQNRNIFLQKWGTKLHYDEWEVL